MHTTLERFTITRYQFPRGRVIGDSQVQSDMHYIGTLELESSSGQHGLGFFLALFHPLPALTLLTLCGITFFAVFLGYGTQLVAMIGFYIVVSLWFHFWRYRFVNRGTQFTMPWPRPQGY